MAIVSGQPPEQGAELVRAMPFALVAHVTSPLDDVFLAWVRDVFEGRGANTVVVSGDGMAVRELLGIEHLAPDAVYASSWDEAMESVAEDRQALALLPWQGVDFHVRALAIDGQHITPQTLESYPYVRHWWLVGSLGEYPEICQALREALAYEPGALVSLVAVGDVMLGRGVGSLIAANSPSYPFLLTREYTGQADVAFANLECPLTSRGGPQGAIAFRARPQVAEGLSYAGFDVLSLANNHSDDYGEVGLLDTLDRLEEQGIAYLGAGRDQDEAHSAVVMEVQGLRIAFLAYNHIEPRYAVTEEDIGGPIWLEPGVLYEQVRQAHDQADFVAVSFHWGTEYIPVPDDFQREVARRAIEAGADLVLGHHPHVIGGVAFLDEGFVAYSLGNFVFDQPWSVETKQGLMLHILIDADGLKQVRLIPVQLEAGQPQVLPWPEARFVLADLFQVTESVDGLPRGSETLSEGGGRGENLELDWATQLGDRVNALRIADLYGGGTLEILVGTGSGTESGGVYVLNAAGSILWQFETESQVQDVAGGDLDGDGRDEVMAATGLMDTPGWIYALDNEGRLRWRYGVEASVQTIAVSDLDGDGRLEVVGGEWGSFDDTVYLLSGDGSLRWKYQTDGSVNVSRVSDLDGDGREEVIVGADDLYLLGSDGRLLWRYPTGGYINDLAVGDLSDDGLEEIVAVTAYPDASILTLNSYGSLLWRYEVESSLKDVIIGDVSGDGRNEVLAGSLDGTVYLLDNDGVLQGKHQGEAPINGLALADGNGDGSKEVVMGTGNYLSPGGVYVVDVLTDAVLASYGVSSWVSGIYVADVDSDGSDEIVVASGGGEVLLLGWTMG
jgi:poly-gamma-glutamate capsule biosynthesis protein CapA/YwtB (metallophosphatase superfamily)